ncbi:hypothetical protein GQ457_13G023750 [Hibiscus cannabinus]
MEPKLKPMELMVISVLLALLSLSNKTNAGPKCQIMATIITFRCWPKGKNISNSVNYTSGFADIHNETGTNLANP